MKEGKKWSKEGLKEEGILKKVKGKTEGWGRKEGGINASKERPFWFLSTKTILVEVEQ